MAPLEWDFYFDGWRYLARLVQGRELQVRRAVSGRPWITPPLELSQAAIGQRPMPPSSRRC